MKNKAVTFDPSFSQFKTQILAVYDLMINAVGQMPKLEPTLSTAEGNYEYLKVKELLNK